ncbi:MAG: transcription-repair coupling factor [Bacteroidia bacterium]|nr:transcription-repair coupling factor [Bacteroidia bacterium]
MLSKIYSDHFNVKELVHLLEKAEKCNFILKGLAGSSAGLLVSSVMSSIHKPSLFVLNDKEEAAYFYNDLVNILNPERVFFFPSSYKRNVDIENPDNSGIVSRTEVLSKIHSPGADMIVVSYPEALIERVITKANLETNSLKLHVGEKVSLDFIMDVLSEYEFIRSDFVYEPGQYAVRGSIIDVFSFSGDHPYRIDFFGDEVESLRSFDIETQLSVQKFNDITIIPDFKGRLVNHARISFFEFIPQDTLVWLKDANYSAGRMEAVYNLSKQNYKQSSDLSDVKTAETIDELLINKQIFLENLNRFTTLEFGHHYYFNTDHPYIFNVSPQPAFNKNFDLLIGNLQEYEATGYNTFILSDNEKQIERIQNIFKDKGKNVKFEPVLSALHEGFIDNDLRICCYTDHQIFDRYHKFQLKSSFSNKETITISDLQNLHPGDYIVHIDHGIGIFGGLEKIEINGKSQEAIRLVYKDNDVLYVNIHQLHRISKYKGKEGDAPKIYKLGTGAWQKLKQATKSKVKDIAKELIALYAKRMEQKGFEFSPDNFMQEELEASFIFEDTPDQVKATKDVKKDMEADYPMDRLICGDVGFGKTEVAIRAAFKAACDSKQIAVLVPTTILALQHYRTFTDRLKNFPCNIDYVSRLKSVKAIRETIKKAEEGKIDILIGTHRLLSNDVKFKDLGLLVIDEEQKFGVAAKEKLKTIKLNVDSLTMTATPIPRTLQFSLMGARDLSIINTPPPNRYPIITELHTFNEDLIREAVNYEVSRNGQVFLIHNRVQNIIEMQALVNKLCPHVKPVVAHGQMEGSELENIMLDFMAGDYDVLIATAIIESGIDIPNANTIIINNAQNFGLSDLHQLRGRVGRSNKKAFCYLLAPPLTSMTQEARRRLKAIEDFSELGSGFNIALQDLDIRGAGNILGAEQSGFIADIGFETYQKILNEAIQELREDEFKDLFAKKTDEEAAEPIPAEDFMLNTDCQVETDLEVLFPEEYIDTVSERIKLYRELDNIETEEKLVAFEKNLADRFGKLPDQTKELMSVVRLRWAAVKLGFEKVILKNSVLTGYFISNQDSLFYKSTIFSNILAYIQKNPNLFKMKESKDKLTLTVENIKNLSEAIAVLNF